MLMRNRADGSAFAHLFGARRAAPKAEEAPAEKPAEEKPKAVEDDEEPGTAPAKEPAAAKPDEAGDPKAPAEGQAPAEKPAEEKPKVTEDDDETDAELAEPDRPAARARARERARIGAILHHPAAAANPSLAMHLAFETPMSRKTACAALAAAGPARPTGLGARMAGAALPHLPADAPPASRSQAIADSWDKAIAAAVPSPKR